MDKYDKLRLKESLAKKPKKAKKETPKKETPKEEKTPVKSKALEE